MRSGVKRLNNWVVVCALTLAGCTVRPVVVRNQEASFDGNVQNSGIIGKDAAGNRILTPHARDRYNGLMDLYGKRFSPPVGRNDGITATTSNTFLLDAQHEFYFLTASRWQKAKEAP